MKYVHQPKVAPDVAEKSRRDVEAVNAWIDALRGTVIAVQLWRSGQTRPYADSVTEGLLHLHQPNALTTGAPLLRTVTREQAKALVELVAHQGVRLPEAGACGAFDEHLECLEPHEDPCGLVAGPVVAGERHHCWLFRIRAPYCD